MIDNLKLIDKNGLELNCEIIALFNNPEFKAKYVVYTDGTKTEGKTDVLVSRGEFVGDKIQLSEITDEKEWQFIDSFLENEIFGADEF